MNVGLWKTACKYFTVFGVVVVAQIAFCNSATPDHPSYDIEVSLGPGNEDAEKEIRKFARPGGNPLVGVSGMDLSNRDFRRAIIHLQDQAIRRITFNGTDFTGADFKEYAFSECSFRKAKLQGINNFEPDATCDLTGADISGSCVRLTKEQLCSTKNYKGKDLSGTILQGDFSGASFAGFNLRGTVFLVCSFGNCDFTDADITWATFDSRKPTHAGAPVKWDAFTKEQLFSTKSYKERNLDGVIFLGCDFRQVDFSGQSLGHFSACDLRDANLTNADFTGYILFNGSFRPGLGAVVLGLSSYGLTECRISAQQFYSTRTYKTGRLPFGLALERMDLDGWDFSTMDLSYVSFFGSSLKGANLTDARNGDFRCAKSLTLEQIKSMWNYKNNQSPPPLCGSRPGFCLPKDGPVAKALSEEKALKQAPKNDAKD